MFKNLKKNEKGFTIIEVLIVLAIAGLIMLVVFLAIPQLQRNQRNSERNAEAGRVATAVSECLANRNGLATGCLNTTNVAYGTLNQFTTAASFANGGTTVPASSTTQIAIWHGRECNAEGSASVASTNPRAFVVLFTLEPAVTRCLSS